jgi:ribosomal-protein-alanine N-acetyltransferase
MEERAQENVVIELMKMHHLDDVMKIEQESFTTPWSRYTFTCELRDNQFSHYIVAKCGDKVVGYGGMWIVLNEAHVTNVAVLPEYRGEGIGELIMRTLMAIAKKYGAEKMTLEVRKSNYVAQNLYSKLGFEPRGIRRGYYADNKEDAVIMWKDSL